MWLQYLILGELATYFAEEERVAGATSALTEAVAERFHRLMGGVVEHLSPEAVTTYTFGPMKAIWR